MPLSRREAPLMVVSVPLTTMLDGKYILTKENVIIWILFFLAYIIVVDLANDTFAVISQWQHLFLI